MLVAAAATGPLALNIFMPSMPGLQREFATDYATVQLALTLYLVGVAVAQLFYGPLSDRYGRRPLMLAGLVLYIAGSGVSLVAPTIEVLIAGRVIQAVGGSAGIVLGRAIIRDLYERERAASMLAYVIVAMVVAPMLAPTIGGFLDIWFGWWAGFLFVLAFGAVVLVAALALLHETHHGERPPLGLEGLVAGFGRLLRVRVYCGYAFQVAFTTSAFYSFLAGAPYVVIDLMGRTPGEYGLYSIAVSLAFMAGNFVTGRITERVGTDRMIAFGTSIALVGAGLLAISAATGLLSPLTLFGSMAVIGYGNGMSLPNGMAGAISVDPRAVGVASGLSGFLQMTVGAAMSYVVGLLLADTAIPLVAVMAAATAAAAAAHWLGVRPGR